MLAVQRRVDHHFVHKLIPLPIATRNQGINHKLCLPIKQKMPNSRFLHEIGIQKNNRCGYKTKYNLVFDNLFNHRISIVVMDRLKVLSFYFVPNNIVLLVRLPCNITH